MWNEEAVEGLIKISARRELTDIVPIIFTSKTTHAIFAAMSYSYRESFLEHLIQIQHDLADELSQSFQQDHHDHHNSEQHHEDLEDFLFNRTAAHTHFFEKVYDQLCLQPYSMHFYLVYSKELISKEGGVGKVKESGGGLEVLRRCLRNIRDEDIEIFLHYNPEVAV
jgi:hypothetical protein